MNNLPDNLKYATTHEWVLAESEDVVSVGISDFAQAQLGDVVFLDLPSVGRQVRAGEAVAVIESVKTASDIHSPLSGAIIEINTQLTDTPEAINEDCHAAWLFRLRIQSNSAEWEQLLDGKSYENLIQDV